MLLKTIPSYESDEDETDPTDTKKPSKSKKKNQPVIEADDDTLLKLFGNE